jgi:hypothetical protein
MHVSNPRPKPPSSGGIPSSESLWLPMHYGAELKRKGGLDKTVYWDVGELVDFIFPRKYQPTYYGVACGLIGLLLESDYVTKEEIGVFLKKNKYSKSTLENKVIPKLVRFGIVKRERELTGKLGKGRGLVLSESLTFANYLERVSFAWQVLVQTGRKRRQTKTS